MCCGKPLTLFILHSLNPLTPVPPVTGNRPLQAVASLPLLMLSLLTKIGIIYTSSTSAGGKDLSNDAQIRVIGLTEPEICTKMLKKSSEKLRPKFPAITPGSSMVKIACLNDAFLEVM